jgi:uncharacterized lipoprotein NlpE involved in copper resistance
MKSDKKAFLWNNKGVILILFLLCMVTLSWFLSRPKIINGRFIGQIPCADCDGIDVALDIRNGYFVFSMKYLGTDDNLVYTENGYLRYTDKNTIAIGNDESVRYYRILNDNELLQLDSEMNKIKSDANYKLTKEGKKL